MERSKKYDWRKMDNIRVIGRFRPANNTEKREEKSQGIEDSPPYFSSVQQVKLKRPSNKSTKSDFKATLDYLFKTTTTQKQIFDRVGRPMVQAVLEGYNATIFAYGQTGSGKTFTMFGPAKTKDNSLIGLVPRCCTYLFNELRKRCSSSVEGSISEWQVSGEFIQIYKEQLLDLLDPKKKARLQIRHNFQTDTPYVANLKSIGLTNMNDMLLTLLEANKNRVTASHKLNAESSRSHMLVMLTLEQQMKDGSVKRSKLNFGDLAGSEDITKALGPNPDPDRLKEAIAINSSLSALTTAISALSKQQRPSYRSSALTHILQDSLGGNSKTTMVVAASPHIMNRAESIRTLRFAMTAKTVKNRARINKEYTRAQLLRKIRELEAQNGKLKARVIELETTLSENGIEVEFTKELYDSGNSSSSSSSDDEFSDRSNKKPKLPKVNKNGKKNLANLSVDTNTTSTTKSKTKIGLTISNNDNINRSSTQQIPTLLNEIEKLNKSLNESIEESKKVNDRNVQLENELQMLQSQLNDNREMYESVKEMNEVFKKSKESLQSRLQELTEQNDKLRNRSDEQQSKLDKQINRLRNKIQLESRDKKKLQREVKELTLQSDSLSNTNESLSSQLKAAQNEISLLKSNKKKTKNKSNNDKSNYNENDKNSNNKNNKVNFSNELKLSNEEKKMTPAQVLLSRFASEEVNDFRLTPQQRMQKTARIMTELSDDIGSLMDVWLPKKYQNKDRKRSKALVYQVRQLIGHFNVATNQLKMQEESYQNDLKLQLKKNKQEIEQLKKDNATVLQLRDDLAEKDEQIEDLTKELDVLRFEKDQLEDQTRQMHSVIDDVQNQVGFLEKELERQRTSTILAQSTLNKLKEENIEKKKLSTIVDEDSNSDSSEVDTDDDDMKEYKKKPKQKKKAIRKTTEMRWRENLKVNDKLDALDEGGLWWTASIVNSKDNMVKIRYDGWGDQYDEWISKNSDRLAVYKSKYSSEKNSKTIIKEGFMYKQGKMFKTWRNRYFILFDGGTMNYYNKKGDDNPISSFNVKEMISTTRESFGRKKYGLTCETATRTWKFACESEQEVKDWIYSINFVKNNDELE